MHHAIAQMTIKNSETLAAYRAKAGEALARHGGTVVQASGALTRLEGQAETPSTMAILGFPTVEAAKAWINDPELAEVHALRNKAGTSTITLLG